MSERVKRIERGRIEAKEEKSRIGTSGRGKKINM